MWRKWQSGRIEILKIPRILKILILTGTRKRGLRANVALFARLLDSRFRGNDGGKRIVGKS